MGAGAWFLTKGLSNFYFCSSILLFGLEWGAVVRRGIGVRTEVLYFVIKIYESPWEKNPLQNIRETQAWTSERPHFEPLMATLASFTFKDHSLFHHV